MKQNVESEQDVASKKCIIADYYTNHYDELKKFVISRLQVVDEAEDILQSDQMISPVTLPCLVYTMARNKIVDYWRCRQQYEKYEHFIRKGSWINRSSEGVESVFSAREVNEILERGIAQLTESQRSVYRLNLYEDMPVRQIAVTLNLKYKQAEKKLGVARKKVRGFVEKALAG